MGIVQKTFVTLQNAYKWVSQDVVRKWFIFVLVTGFVLNTFNAFALTAEDYKVDINESYEQSDISGTALTGDKERNVDKTTEFQTLGALHTTLKTVCGIELCFKVKDEDALSQVSPLMRRGLLGIVNDNMMALVTTPPTVNVTGHLAQEWIPGYDMSTSVYAAESGYQYLIDINISDLWETVRTIAYIFFVVILIVAGFMIIFRHKIGGQMAVTIFNALPNVVIGLIMATFSFALVGIMIDIGAILVRVVASVLSPSGQNLISVDQPFALLGIFSGNGGIVAKALADSVGSFDVSNMIGFGAGALLGTILLVIGAANLISVAVLALVLLIVVAVIGFASVKVYITLLKAYLSLLLDTIVSPLIWALASLPGNQNMGWDWFFRVVKNILTFPLVFFFVNLGIYFLTTNIGIGFPSGLAGGDISANGTGDSVVGLAIKFFIPLMLMFIAAESPKFLEDIFPAKSSAQNTSKAMQGIGESFKKLF